MDCPFTEHPETTLKRRAEDEADGAPPSTKPRPPPGTMKFTVNNVLQMNHILRISYAVVGNKAVRVQVNKHDDGWFMTLKEMDVSHICVVSMNVAVTIVNKDDAFGDSFGINVNLKDLVSKVRGNGKDTHGVEFTLEFVNDGDFITGSCCSKAWSRDFTVTAVTDEVEDCTDLPDVVANGCLLISHGVGDIVAECAKKGVYVQIGMYEVKNGSEEYGVLLKITCEDAGGGLNTMKVFSPLPGVGGVTMATINRNPEWLTCKTSGDAKYSSTLTHKFLSNVPNGVNVKMRLGSAYAPKFDAHFDALIITYEDDEGNMCRYTTTKRMEE